MWNEAVEVIEATEAVEAVEVIEATDILRPRKSILSTPESSRLLNLALFWCFENHFLVESWNIIFQFLHLFCLRLLRPAYVTFLKIGSKNKNFHISEFQNYLLICIFLSLRAKLKKTLCPRTPCTNCFHTFNEKASIVFFNSWTSLAFFSLKSENPTWPLFNCTWSRWLCSRRLKISWSFSDLIFSNLCL